MPITKSDDRFQRVVKFLLAVHDRKIAGYLAERGFSEADRMEGWELFDRATGRHVSMRPIPSSGVTKELLARIDAWENIWFDVASAALTRQFPEMRARLFLNISKSSGPAVIVSVKTLLDRIDELATDDNERARGALALLEQRGLNEAIRGEARAMLLEATAAPMDPQLPESPDAEQARQQAVEEMWAWYKDWATTARTVIRSKALRIKMGVSQARRGALQELESQRVSSDKGSAVATF